LLLQEPLLFLYLIPQALHNVYITPKKTKTLKQLHFYS
jgi:hypothetical protein